VLASYPGTVSATVCTSGNRSNLLAPKTPSALLENLAAEQRVDDRFLQLLAQFTHQGRNLSDKQKANSYAPKMFAQDETASASRMSKAAFEAAMNRLLRPTKFMSKGMDHPRKAGPVWRLGRVAVARRSSAAAATSREGHRSPG
jgi:hypothetical protein